ncbi:uncharacterized protein LOC127852964 [Dreissena polymorpha]|uniref:uncharacterized protein LOC127852964 n=1 Tax=Dreissena polymorpha TaxID=45954 RepID=UPI0022646B83|nr:uncharacterized protein LOC127852964 [Dreissena polymorpha]
MTTQSLCMHVNRNKRKKSYLNNREMYKASYNKELNHLFIICLFCQQILVGSRYQVQWGNGRQVTQVVVLATGSQKEMKARETEEAQNPSVAVAAPAAQLTKPPVKRPRVKKNEKREGVGAHGCCRPGTGGSADRSCGSARPCCCCAASDGVPNCTRSYYAVSGGFRRGCAIITGDCACPECTGSNYAVDALQTLYHHVVSSEPSPPQETVVDLSTLGLPEEEVRRIHEESNNAGHFACLLVRKVFPELFGPGNLRSLYNWNGNGQKKKLALNETRRKAVSSAVLGYHPEVRGPGPFQDWVIIKVNEMLRRNDKRPLASRQLNIDTPLLDGYMTYMNSDNM